MSTPAQHPSIALLLLAALPIVPALPSLPAPTVDSLASGAWARSVETELNKHNLLQSVGLPLWAAAEWLLFHEGRAGLVVNEDEVLFTAEELALQRPVSAGIAEARLKAAALRAALPPSAQLVIVPLPDKLRVFHPGRLDAEHADRYAALLEGLAADGHRVVDLATPFVNAPARDQLFLHTDTHWSPEGARLAAQSIAAAIPTRGDQPCRPVKAAPTVHRGDLLSYLPLGPFADWLGPAADTLATPSCPQGTGGLLDEAALPLALIGTSYSADPRWGFEAALQAELSMDVLNLSVSGRGPFAAVDAALTELPVELTAARLVLWELPERYLTLETVP
jgi:alginate O-acetyltransferase complex protein AlgJ